MKTKQSVRKSSPIQMRSEKAQNAKTKLSSRKQTLDKEQSGNKQAAKTKQSLLQKEVAKCSSIKFEGLEIYYTKDIELRDLLPYHYNHFLESYIVANMRIISLLENFSELSQLKLSDKICKVFITTNPDLFMRIGHSCFMDRVIGKDLPRRFGYVSQGINVNYMDSYAFKNFLPPRSTEIDGQSHEFTHILLSSYLETQCDRKKYWGSVFEEGFVTLLNNQFIDLYLMKKDLISNTVKGIEKINHTLLTKKGFFTIDNRSISVNYEYQYSAAVVAFVDKILRRTEEYKSTVPLSGILRFVNDHMNSKTSILDDLKSLYDITISKIEDEISAKMDSLVLKGKVL